MEILPTALSTIGQSQKQDFLSKANSLSFVQGVSMVRQRGTFALRGFSGTKKRVVVIGDTLSVVGDCNGCFGIFQ